MSSIDRRHFLLTGSATVAAALTGAPAAARTHGPDTARKVTARRAVTTTGTTLESVAVPTGSGSYQRLTAGPGWPLITRTDLTGAGNGRDDRRVGLTSFVQFTDIHLVDAQSPARFEYLHPFIHAAHRPHETLSTQGATALVQRVNSLRTGPFTGVAPKLVVCTGDNTDNHEHIELEWYLKVLSGGSITPNTGAPDRYEGVQNSGSTLFWNPGMHGSDMYKQQGFGYRPDLLPAALVPFRSPGLRIPWYAVFGNHDDSVEGTLPSQIAPLEAMYTGSVKLQGLGSAVEEKKLADQIRSAPRSAALALPKLDGAARLVTTDARRAPFTPEEFIAAHLREDVTGPGPHGHGFTEENAARERGYYTFGLADGVTGISMDTTCRGGFTDGALGTEQLRWIEKTLTAGSSRYYDSDGTQVRHQADDQYFVLFSHHTSTTMDNPVPDPARPFEQRHDGDELVALLNRFPNVLAWVNGHTHRNQITPHPGDTPEQGFWEINTASHTDYPQHARIIEIADNGDGTLSLFTTLIEAKAPYAAAEGDHSLAGLASLYRELSYNDIHRDDSLMGAAADHNTELLVADPLARTNRA